MDHQNWTLLRFVGGPFDGFSRRVSTKVDELPAGVALPLNQRVRHVMGLDCADTDRIAIYERRCQVKMIGYHFREIRRTA